MPAEPWKPRALIVEDEAPIRELKRLHLELAGFDIEETPDGLDGVSLCRAVRAGGPNIDTPVLMITARDTESDKVLGLEADAAKHSCATNQLN